MEQEKAISKFKQSHDIEGVGDGQFYIHKIEDAVKAISLPHQKREFYKIALAIKSTGVLSYADKDIYINDNALVFSNPLIPYSWTNHSGKETGYFCCFTDGFVGNKMKVDSLSKSPLFRINGNHVLFPPEASMNFLKEIMERMLYEWSAGYENKYDLLRNYVQIIMHEALKIDPPKYEHLSRLNSSRTIDLFMELLQRQFPITAPGNVLKMRTASQFATQLCIHPNHLNRILKKSSWGNTNPIPSKACFNFIAQSLICITQAGKARIALYKYKYICYKQKFWKNSQEIFVRG